MQKKLRLITSTEDLLCLEQPKMPALTPPKKPKDPFVNIRLMIEPPEGLKKLKLKLKEPTWFVEVIHGNHAGVLSTQWIPLLNRFHPQASLDEKTHYGKKSVLLQQAGFLLSLDAQKKLFDMKAIGEFVFLKTYKNKFSSTILSGSGTALGQQLILCVPTSSGECRLGISTAGDIRIDYVPGDLALNIETEGSVEIGTALKCREVNLTSNNFKNIHSLRADKVEISTLKKLVNAGVLFAKSSLSIAAGEEMTNRATAVLGSEGKLNIGTTPLVANAGTIAGAESRISVAALYNEATGMVAGTQHLDLSLNASSYNHGQVYGQALAISAKDFENGLSGKILGNCIDLTGNTALDNHGLVEAKQDLCLNTDAALIHQKSGTLKAGFV